MGSFDFLADALFVLLSFLRTALGSEIGVDLDGYTGAFDPRFATVAAMDGPGDATGRVRLASSAATTADGPTVHWRLERRLALAGLALDLTITNGELDGPRTPHVFERIVELTVPNHLAIAPRYDWIDVQRTAPGLYEVDLGSDVYQGVLLHVPLVVLPVEFVTDTGSPVPFVAAQLDAMGWLADGPGFVEGLPRASADPSDASTLMFRSDGLPSGEAEYIGWNYGGAGGGAAIRFDFGAEWEWMSARDRFEMMERWSWLVHRRPQRGYLTFDGEPLTTATAPVGFKFALGPNEFMIADHATNAFGFDESWVAAHADQLLGIIDLQHGPRWFGPDAYLAQRFACPNATDRIHFMAAVGRLSFPDPLATLPGHLSREAGWNAVLQATSVHVADDPNEVRAARSWLADYVDVCARDQTAWGGLCSWTVNKEATTLGPLYVSQSTGVPIEDVPIVPVTQPYQEAILAWGLWCAGRVGIAVDPALLDGVLTFSCEVARDPARGVPWYRTGIDGARMSQHTDGYYAPAPLALAVAHDVPNHRAWVADYFAGLSVVFGPPAGPNFERWRNRWHLLGAAEQR